MNKLFKAIIIIITTTLLIQCTDEKFTIAKGKVGKLNTKTTIAELDKIFKNDSIVKILSEGEKGNGQYLQDDDEYQIYEKGGKHLLTIIPKQQLDSTSTIKSIEIFDKRYTTEKGLNINSTFQQVNANNKISSIETSFSSATLFIDQLNTTISIDKDDLGLKGNDNQKITIEQIPDLAKIKSFTVWFN